jgi:hypothetical protein
VAGFVRVLLQRIVEQGLKNLTDNQRGPFFSEGPVKKKFHCIFFAQVEDVFFYTRFCY